MLHNLHLLRAIAALAVVYFHISSSAGLGLRFDVGGYGVDIFFVISGFIISYIGREEGKFFVRRRLIRIVPFYWAATIVVFVAAALAPNYFRSTTADYFHLFCSLLFIPRENPATGEMMPTLVLGWSLNFEMFFYILFALSLKMSVHRAPLIVAGLIPSFILLVGSIGINNDVLNYYARPISLEFCFGIVVFYAYNYCVERTSFLKRWHWIGVILTLLAFTSFIAIFWLEHLYKGNLPRYIIAGLPASILVLSILLLEKIYGISSNSRAMMSLGEASYIIYLIHPYIVFGLLRTVFSSVDRSALIIFMVIIFLMMVTIGISIAIHRFFEKPLLRYLRQRWAS